jgi:hypothetical protein
MKNTNILDRLSFLAEQFDVFECSNSEDVNIKVDELKDDGNTVSLIFSGDGTILAILSSKVNEKDRLLKSVSVCSDVFASMISSDPTKNKMYLQWMLNVFIRFIKDGSDISLSSAIRFVVEDLPQANLYLQLFEDNKRKKKFIDLCKVSYSLVDVKDATNINQYKSLSQLFDAVDPFIEKEPSAVERTLNKFVESGQAEIPVKDRKFTLYIPKTTAASVVFAKFANWCTAREGNGMFNTYTQNNLKPNGKRSDIYIIINNKFFSGESKELYQVHFETDQLKDYKNGDNVSIFDTVLSESEGLTNFFKEELLGMAKTYKKGVNSNKYLNYLIKFGFAESLFELIDYQTPRIKFMNREIPKLPDISKFNNLDELIITNAKLIEIHHSIGSLINLEMLVLSGNNIKKLPKEIGNLKNLIFLNLIGNKITEIPDEIKYLDKSNGGSLNRIAIDMGDIGEQNYKRLKLLLPTTTIN